MSIAHLLNQTATIANKTSLDRYGRPQMGSATSISCRFQETDRTKLMPTGETIGLDGLMFVPASVSVSNDDVITYGGLRYKVVGIGKIPGRDGSINHQELEVTQWQT